MALSIANLYAADLAEADRCLALARQTQIEMRDPFIGAVMSLLTARSDLTGGDLARARRDLTAVDRWVRTHPRLTFVIVMRGALRAEVELAAGAPQAAAAALADLDQRLAELRSAGHLDGDDDPAAVTRGHVLLAVGRPEDACAAVSPLLGAGGAVAAEAWLVTALAQDRLRQDASATDSLERALALAEQEGAVQNFLRRNDRVPVLLWRHLDVHGTHRSFTERLLARIEQGPSASGPVTEIRTAVDLTERELSVLAYLPTLSTNPEIAERLNISVNTVKQHLKTINRKLGVNSRREAVRVARRLGLLPDPS